MIAALSISAVDNPAARPEDSLTEQMRLELLVKAMGDSENFKDDDGEFLPIDEWEDDVYITDEGLVQRIHWPGIFYRGSGGSIDLKLLPRNVEGVNVGGNKLSGTLNLADLPGSLLEFTCDQNHLDGTLDLGVLPADMEELDVNNNKFSGSLHLGSLPKAMRIINADYNAFEGTIDLRHLPDTFKVLSLGKNKLSGPVDLTALPPLMMTLGLYGNGFTGPINLTQLPNAMGYLILDGNKLSGELDLRALPLSIKRLALSSNEFTKAIGNDEPRSGKTIFLGGNLFDAVYDDKGDKIENPTYDWEE